MKLFIKLRVIRTEAGLGLEFKSQVGCLLADPWESYSNLVNFSFLRGKMEKNNTIYIMPFSGL